MAAVAVCMWLLILYVYKSDMSTSDMSTSDMCSFYACHDLVAYGCPLRELDAADYGTNVLYMVGKFLMNAATSFLPAIISYFAWGGYCWGYCPCSHTCSSNQACLQSPDGTCHGICEVSSDGRVSLAASIPNSPQAHAGTNFSGVYLLGTMPYLAAYAVYKRRQRQRAQTEHRPLAVDEHAETSVSDSEHVDDTKALP